MTLAQQIAAQEKVVDECWRKCGNYAVYRAECHKLAELRYKADKMADKLGLFLLSLFVLAMSLIVYNLG